MDKSDFRVSDTELYVYKYKEVSSEKKREGFESMGRISLIATFTLYASLWAADKVTPLDIRTGLWEVTTTTATSDESMLPAAVLEKLTPEQRARVEERMKARRADAPKTSIARECLTRQELERGMPFYPLQKSCRWAVLSSTGSKAEIRGECVNHGTKTERRLQIQVLSPEEAEGSIHCFTKGDDSSPAATSALRAKWIGPECKNPR